MRPYSKLRGRMAEVDITGEALAHYLGRCDNYVSARFNNKGCWSMDDAYKIMELLEIPFEEIITYFPPNGGLKKKSKTGG